MEISPLPAVVLTSLQASNYLGCSGDVLKLARVSGALWSNPAPQFLKAGTRKILYRKVDLDNFLEQFKTYSNNAQVNSNV